MHSSFTLCGIAATIGAALLSAGEPSSLLSSFLLSGLDSAYTKEIHRELDLFAAWEPSSRFDLGDYGEMDGKMFKKLGNIKRFGINIRKKTYESGPFDYSSSGAISLGLDIGAKDSKGDYSVDLKLDFSKEKSILFMADGMTTERIENIGAVGDALVELYKEKGKDWKLSYVVITEVKRASSGLVVISQDADTKVTVSGKAAIKKDGAKIADIDLRNLAVQVTKGKAFTQTLSAESTPLLQLHEVKDPLLKKPFFTEYK
ncbi:MAG: hypothetical protein JNM84_02090 [Planctomycetes bacterium]|nr:hypothetical protein [Planctomycetota bacterium]